ncbi:MAG: IMP cyclohydrolase [Lentisphaeria bacterium]|nr:IMP cyclohydrolase [Lentisphaeria bacterium]
MAAELSRSSYLEKNVGSFPDSIEVAGQRYEKVDDLRYGTNPHQPAAYYRPAGSRGVIGGMEILKTGKNGLSQTNLEDISGALNIVKFCPGVPACAVMKHVNPSGAAMGLPGEDLKQVYIKARDADARAAFGSVIAFNVRVDAATAEEIMSTFVECVVAPGFSPEALAVFNDAERFKLNRHVRIIRCGDIDALPKYCSDAAAASDTIKVLTDGSLILAAPLLTSLRTVADLRPARGENTRCGQQVSTVPCSEAQKRDLLFSWHVNLSVRSNGVVIVSGGQTLSVGTGEQDRVGAIEQAIAKFNQKYSGSGILEGSVMSSDGFFPFEDGVETAAAAGIRAIIAPAGSLRDADVIKRANELGVALFHAPERIFSHH